MVKPARNRNSGVGLDHLLREGSVENEVVQLLQRRPLDALGVLQFFEVPVVADVDALQVALDRQLAVDLGELGAEVGLVKVVHVVHVRPAEAALDGQGRVGADEHGHATGPSRGAGAARRVHRDVAGHHQGKPAVPGRGLYPVHGVEQRAGAPVASVCRVHALDGGIAGVDEQLHQHRLDRLGLVDDRLGTDFKSPDVGVRDVVFLHEVLYGCEADVSNAEACVLNDGARNIPVMQMEFMSSRSSQNAILESPNPDVYFPADTPSCFSLEHQKKRVLLTGAEQRSENLAGKKKNASVARDDVTEICLVDTLREPATRNFEQKSQHLAYQSRRMEKVVRRVAGG
ncbi:MAG: hypothetical protein BJ554DRAFT_3617 [Olpidium bornovanus]|uniref:Uncharacterized protein n=1 Tax=Olpidium bornovanus TaxID=278681 RepID=A0A8H7ZPB8_9FUNG|nr:MAG: hypothetical protein BJ554DRAFT_3617 [Olpidium bornovanus]